MQIIMKVLLSIRPEYANKIFDKEKLYEFRRVIFKSHLVKIIIVYASSPISKVIGEFMVGEILSNTPEDLWKKTMNYAGVDKNFYDRYFAGRDVGHAIEVKNARRYRKPKELNDFNVKQAPQSFVYINS